MAKGVIVVGCSYCRGVGKKLDHSPGDERNWVVCPKCKGSGNMKVEKR